VLKVTTSADAGTGSLRAAITSANTTPGPATIVFDLPPPANGCLVNIALKSELDVITGTLTIDGYSQPGSALNTAAVGTNAKICVGLAGLGNRNSALLVDPAAGSDVSLDVSGLAFSGFKIAAVELLGGAGNVVWGNHFGTGLPGTEGLLGWIPNTDDIAVANGAPNSLIGCFSPGKRNLLGSATGVAIRVTNSSIGTGIVNNLIGTDRSGASASGTGNVLGIYVSDTDGTYILNNTIAGNSGNAIVLAAAIGNTTDTLIYGNRIGVPEFGFCFPVPCTPSLPNGGVGVLVSGPVLASSIKANTIAFNAGGGVKLSDSGGTPAQIRISADRLFGNGAGTIAAEGIDISPLDGAINPNDNDASGPSSVPNGGLNYPVLSIAAGAAASGALAGTLATANGTYMVELFASRTCAASGYGEGEKLVGTVPVTISNATLGFNGSAPFLASLKLDSGTFAGYPVITATAIDSTGNTSEFSKCVIYNDHIFTDGFEP